MEIMSWDTNGEVDFGVGYSSCLMINSFETNACTDRKSCELLTSASTILADYTIFRYLALRFGPKLKNEIVGSRGGHVPKCRIAGDATDE